MDIHRSVKAICSSIGDDEIVEAYATVSLVLDELLADAVLRGQILARHMCMRVATSDGCLTRRELDERFAALQAGDGHSDCSA